MKERICFFFLIHLRKCSWFEIAKSCSDPCLLGCGNGSCNLGWEVHGVSHRRPVCVSVTLVGSWADVGTETWWWGKNPSDSISRNDFFSDFVEWGKRANDSCLVREVNDHHRDTESLGRRLEWRDEVSEIRDSVNWAPCVVDPICSVGDGGSSRAHAGVEKVSRRCIYASDWTHEEK